MLQSHPGHFSPARVTPVNVYEEARKAPLWEQAFYTIWLFSIFLPIDAFQPIRYLCIVGLLSMLVLHAKDVLPLMRKAWPIFMLPIFVAFSLGWTLYPGAGTKTVLLVLLTPTLLVVLASRLRAAEFLRLIMIAGWFGTLYCIPFYATFAAGGPYAPKNIFAFHMMIVIVLSMGAVLNEEEHILLRLIAIAFIPVAFLFQLLADSATSLVFAVAGCAVLLAIKLVWGGVSRVRHMRTTMIALFIGAVLTLTLAVLSMPENSMFDDFLALVGKDSTFTGRTAIWNAAEIVSKQHPWIGVGVEGFWNPLTGLAQTLNENDSKPFGTKLSFHSAFWEVRVHFGYIGLALFLNAMAWSGLRTVGLWLKEGNLVNSTLLVMYIVIFTSCFTESYATGTTNMMVYFFYFGGLAAFQHGERKFLGVARLVERPA